MKAIHMNIRRGLRCGRGIGTAGILALLLALVGTTPGYAILVFSTGFNGDLDRDAGALGSAALNGAGFSFVPDTVGGGADTVLQVDAIAAEDYVALTGTGVTDETSFAWSAVFDVKIDFTSGSGGNFQTFLNSGAGDQEVFTRANGTIDIGTPGNGGGDGVLSNGVWHRVVFTSPADSNAGRVFVDGVETTIGSPTFDPDTLATEIGLFRDDSGDNRIGSRFANFALYNNELLPVEVSALGGASSSVIDYQSGDFEPLELTVNKSTGMLTISNNNTNGLFAQDVNYYEIISQNNSNTLSNTWNSFADQQLDSLGSTAEENWQQGGGSDANRLTEAFLLGSTLFGPNGDSETMASGWVGSSVLGVDEDLVFRYGLTDGSLVEGAVAYLAGGALLGDFNGNGSVDLADYTVWRDNLGAVDESGFAPGTGNGGGVDVTDYTDWKANFGNTGAGSLVASATVPEPSTWVVGLIVMLLCFGLRRETVRVSLFVNAAALLLVALLLSDSSANAAKTADRLYGLGDDSAESPSLGDEVGALFTNNDGDRFTADSQVTDPGFSDAQDIQVLGAPLYASVSDRPLYTSGLGVAFDGQDDVLSGQPLNILEETGPNIPNFPFEYAGLRARGLQMWVKPDLAGLQSNARQTIVLDTIESGGVAISADGNWTQAFDNEIEDSDIPSTVPVVANAWAHVMHHIHPTGDPGAPVTIVGSESGMTGVVYVNGLAVSASNDFPDNGGATTEDRVGRLTIGAAEIADQDSNPETADYGEFFDGTIDNLEMYVFGDNTTSGGQNYGTFNLFTDNEWIANEIAQAPLFGNLQMGDINRDGSVSGDGTGLAATDDVRAFIDGWLFENRIEGWGGKVSTVGDWSTWGQGDLNLDGMVNLADWALLNQANPSMGAAALTAISGQSVPEPSAVILSALLGATILAIGRSAKQSR